MVTNTVREFRRREGEGKLAISIAGSSVPAVLAHGDFKRGNVSNGNVLIDWDEYGVYPAGYDPAYAFAVWSLNERMNHCAARLGFATPLLGA